MSTTSQPPPSLVVQQQDEDMNEELFPCENPRYPEMRSLHCRIKSFQMSQSSLSTRYSPQVLAEAGFFADVGDEVKCWYCGCNLPSTEGENFWNELWRYHAKHYPECEHVLREKGIAFVQEVFSHNDRPSNPVRTLRNESARSGAEVEEVLNPDPPNVNIFPRPDWHGEDYRMEESATATVYTTPGIRITSINLPGPSTSRNFNLISSTGGNTVNISTHLGSLTVTQSSLPETDSPIVREAMNMGFSFEEIKDAMSRQILRRGQVHLTTRELVDDIMNRRSEVHTGRMREPSLVSPPTTPETKPSKVCDSEIKESSSQTVEELLSTHSPKCSVCNDEEAEILFLPCTHLITCSACSSLLVYCPACGVAIERWIKANRNSNS